MWHLGLKFSTGLKIVDKGSTHSELNAGGTISDNEHFR